MANGILITKKGVSVISIASENGHRTGGATPHLTPPARLDKTSDLSIV